MAEMMAFQKTFDEFIEFYSFMDKEQVYTNGAQLIPAFRVQQAVEHYFEPVHACWLDTPYYTTTAYGTNDIYKCSHCGEETELGDEYEYCPHCGAKMDEVSE